MKLWYVESGKKYYIEVSFWSFLKFHILATMTLFIMYILTLTALFIIVGGVVE